MTPTRSNPKLQTTMVKIAVFSKNVEYSEKFTNQATSNPQIIKKIHNDCNPIKDNG